MSQQPRGPRYGQPNFEYIAKMAATPPEEDGPVYMVNLMKYRASADYADGNPTGRTGREADDAYAPTAILRDIGAEIVFVGDVERQLEGDVPQWDRVAVVKYPTRVSFLAMQRRSDFKEKHVHKDAGMEQTIVLSCTPLPVASVSLPVPDEHAPVLLRVANLPTGMAFEDTPGAAIEADLSVEAAVLGDGREWHRVRFEALPSGLTAEAASQPATAGRYTLILAPTRNRMAESARQTLADARGSAPA
jgi:hypothetical protein